ncbi:hypothetical protein D3C87_1791880 [compost metagenome]
MFVATLNIGIFHEKCLLNILLGDLAGSLVLQNQFVAAVVCYLLLNEVMRFVIRGII